MLIDSKLAPPHPSEPGRYLNIIGLWKPCPGISEECENYVVGPYWVCLRCFQKFELAHGTEIPKDRIVHPDLL